MRGDCGSSDTTTSNGRLRLESDAKLLHGHHRGLRLGRDDVPRRGCRGLGTKGSFRLVIAVDDITEELKQTVLYINRHTVAEVRLLALELRYADHEGVEILLPEVYGEESADEPRAPHQWDEPSFLRKLEEEHGKAEAQVAREVIEWAREQLRRLVGHRRKTDCFSRCSIMPAGSTSPSALWTYGKAEIKFGDLAGGRRSTTWGCAAISPSAERDRGVSIPEDAIDAFSEHRLADLAASPEALDSFKGTLDWFCEAVRGVKGDHADH